MRGLRSVPAHKEPPRGGWNLLPSGRGGFTERTKMKMRNGETLKSSKCTHPECVGGHIPNDNNLPCPLCFFFNLFDESKKQSDETQN
jgi:hypothetical protein